MTTAETQFSYESYVLWMREVADIRYANAILQWDQETYMPAAGADRRSQQIATLSELAHTCFTNPQRQAHLDVLQAAPGLTATEQKNVGLTRYDYQQQVKLPGKFVRDMSETVSRSFQAWNEARQKSDFSVFSTWLTRLVDLKKREADLLGWMEHPYNALLNQYERGCTVTLLDKTFQQLREPLSALLQAIRQQPPVDSGVLNQFYPEEQQWQFSLELLQKMGFDFSAGRQDKSAHPFSTNFSARDVRITTRIDPQDISNMTFSAIHELGHALYEQGLPDDQYGLPLGEYTSLGIHESQSRLWENNVGRSLEWCTVFLPVMQQYFPEQLAGTDALTLFRAINRVEPTLIRTEADELTYHFHIIIRYELEKALIGGTLKAADIPEYWKEAYMRYLGIAVPNDRTGCLQDVHWSHGSFGYFPTYSLGSLYAAQFFGAAISSQPQLERQLAAGDYTGLRQWLKQEIHIYGRFFTSEELCRRISGEGLNIDWFMQYVRKKYRFIYAFNEESQVL